MSYFTTYPKRWEEGELPNPPKRARKQRRKAVFQCMECGRKFYSTAAAERAADSGCPGCSGVDIEPA